jgi:glycosyltransferase involved in cell wall biosynthesis
MKASCLINTYNYARYVERAIESALHQSSPFFEILVVDDGSTDESGEVLAKYVDHPKVQVIQKENGGQLSAFNAGVVASSGDLICFLDADDMYQPDFLMKVIGVFDQHPGVDHVFCDRWIIDGNDELIEVKHRYKEPHDIYFGPTAAKTRILYSWTGNSTSMNAVRREIVEKIFPLNLEGEYRINADMPLIYGSSVVGARKYYLREPLVNYRIHGDNLWAGRKKETSKIENVEWERTRTQTLNLIMEKNGIKITNPAHGLVQEYKDHPTKTKKETLIYLYASWKSDQGFFKRFRDMARIVRAYQ